jgi:hypothetical protein
VIPSKESSRSVAAPSLNPAGQSSLPVANSQSIPVQAYVDSHPSEHTTDTLRNTDPLLSIKQIVQDAKREAIQDCLEAFGDDAKDITSGDVTAASVIQLANSEHLKKSPPPGSKMDKVLKCAVSFARNLDLYSKALDPFVSYSPDVAKIVWGSCRMLLQVSEPVPPYVSPEREH